MVAALASNWAKERYLGSAAPRSLWAYLGLWSRSSQLRRQFAFDGRPVSSPKDVVGLAVAAIIGGLVSGLVGGALLAGWFERHEHDG
jgi:hypothetical protein